MKRKPSKSSLNNPAFWQYFESMCLISLHYFQRPAELNPNPLNQFTNIPSIGKNLLNTVKILILQCLQYFLGTNTIVNVCGMDYDNHYQTKGINNNVTLSSFNFFTSIIANISLAKITCPGTLAVHNAYRWCRLFADTYSNSFNKIIVCFFNQPFSLPLAEVVINRLPWSIFFCKRAPLNSAFSNVKQRIHDFMKKIFPLLLVGVNNFSITCHWLSVKSLG